MAITDLKQYAHLTAADVEELARELDAIRTDIEESRGERDARYIRRSIQLQRALAAGGRIALFASKNKVAWVAGTALLATAKIIENMELGHNIIHGQWDWMNDPEIHSTEWEWDTTSPSVHWKKSHNFIHHKYTNVVGLDDDIGYGIMRLTRDQRWERWMIGNPVYNILLGTLFEWGVALHGVETTKYRRGDKSMAEVRKDLRIIGKKIGKQVGKDYIVFPALTGPNWKHTLGANAVANLIRNYWSYMVIFCGHFPDGAEKFTRDEFENESQPEWYPADARFGELSCRSADGVHERQPVLSDRTPLVPGPTEQSLRRNQRARPGTLRQVRPSIHHRIPWPAIHAVVLDNPQARSTRQAPQGDLR
jgi:fatty acid desaturase